MRFTFRPLDQFPGKRHREGIPSLFSASYTDTMLLLERELEMISAKNPVIELDLTDAELRMDGMPRSDARPRTPAVVLSFESKYGPLQFATDTFLHWQENLRAIALGLESLRRVDRYGINQGGKQYTGWKALGSSVGEPVGQMTVERAQAFMQQYGGDGPLAKQYRKAAAFLHPDNQATGDEALFKRLQQAMEVLKRYG